MKNQNLMMKQLDRQLREWQSLNEKYAQPRFGWVSIIRKALGMTAQQLGDRLGLARSRIVQLENAERYDAVTLRTLKKAAAAMDCELIYAIVPKVSLQGKTLEEIVKTQAEKVAATTVNNVAHSMALEQQSVAKKQQQRQKEELVKTLLEGPRKKIWGNK